MIDGHVFFFKITRFVERRRERNGPWTKDQAVIKWKEVKYCVGPAIIFIG
jgi:hypothetical protein